MKRAPTARYYEKCDAAWAVAMRLQQFGAAEISLAITLEQRVVAKIIRGWEADGRVRQIVGGKQSSPRAIFEILPMQEVKPPPQMGDAVDQMWTIIRKFPAFSPVDLVAHCAVAVTIEDARAYCRTLLAANYLRAITKAQPGKKEASYKLIRPTGPRAPRKRRVTCIIDDNLGTVLPLMEDGL